MKAFIIAGVRSGDGKTTAALGIMGALKGRGLTVQAFKAGPDYIDPGHHRALLGRPSYNLDTWMMGVEGVKKTFRAKMRGADIGVVEGVMGLFDGRDGLNEEGSTAHLAKVLNLPVILVVDAAKTARSAAALLAGFHGFDPDVRVRYVIFNRVGSPAHFKLLKDAASMVPGIKVLGHIPRSRALTMPERHLGLVTSADLDRGAWQRVVRRAALTVERNVDLDGLVGRRPGGSGKKTSRTPVKTKKTVRIAVALDRAFCFYYEENFEILKGLGAEIRFFSPIKDKRLPEGASGVYIGGGYPELNAGPLAANTSIRDEIKRSAAEGMPVYAECGGLMYLGSALRTGSGESYPMTGLFPWTTGITTARRALGYREVTTLEGCPFVKEGSVLRGHEYRWSRIIKGARGIKKVFTVTHPASGDTGREGYIYKNVLASYVHLHFASNPEFAEGYVKSCGEFNSMRRR